MSPGDTPVGAPSAPTGEAFGGRAREREILRGALEAHRRTGRGALVLIGAGPGMGKTALVQRFVREAPAVSLVRVRCTGEAVPFGPLLELERQVRPPAGGGEREGAAEGEGDGPRARVASALVALQLADARRAQGPTEPRTTRNRALALHDGFVELLGELAGLPEQAARVLLLEDLHAADEDTLHVLRRLTSPPYPLRTLILANYRDPAERPELQRLLHRVDALSGRDARFVHLRLAPLDAPEVAEVLGQRFPGVRETSPEAVAELGRRCAGSPERIEAAVARLRAEGVLREGRRGWALAELPADPAVYEAPPRRRVVSALRPSLRATLRRAAVLGVRFSPAVLAHLENRDELAVLEDFQAAWDEGQALVEPLRDSFVFLDPDVPALLRDELLRPLRQAYAARAAEALRRGQRRDPDSGLARVHPARVAELAELAGDAAGALQAHLEAARHDELTLALDAAVAHLRRARQLLARGVRPAAEADAYPSWRLLADLGRLLVSRPAEADGPGAAESETERSEGLQLLTEAVAAADAADADVHERAALRATLGLALAEEAHTRGEGLNQVRRARTLLVVGGMPFESWRMARHEVGILIALDDGAGASKVGQSALRFFRETPDDPAARAEIAWTLLRLAALRRKQLAPPGSPDRETQRKALEAALEEARLGFRGTDDRGAALTLAERARLIQEHARERSAPPEREALMIQAHRLLEEALALHAQTGDRAALAETRQTQGQVLAALSRAPEAAEQLLAAGRLRLALGGRDVSDLLALLDELGGGPVLRARDQLREAAGLPPVEQATRVIPPLVE
jgi:hypothetical protein